uniref:Retinoic acid early-inducible protein 1 domain-containing protein n=1 Tax=Peromyscus maniculatus bairdii TaxID=230844 RepID=A0A8C8URC7_PERMB
MKEKMETRNLHGWNMERIKFSPQGSRFWESLHRVLCKAVLRTLRFSQQLQSCLLVAWSQEGTMTKTGAPRCNLSQNLRLWVLLSCLGSTLPADTHSLSCNVTVKTHTTPGEPCYEGQCSLDRESFLQYDDNKATPLGDLGKVVHTTEMWTDIVQELENLGHEFRKKLAETKQRMTKIHGHPTLQAIMLSNYEQGQIVGASWQFNISGKCCMLLNTMNMSWTLISLEAGDIMNEWKNDEELTKYLKNLLKNFCHWLKELLKLPWERTRSTSRAPDITQLPPTVNITQLTVWSFASHFKTSPVRNLQMPMNCSMNCYKPQRKERPMEPSGEFPNQATKMLSQEDELQDMKVRKQNLEPQHFCLISGKSMHGTFKTDGS